MLLRVDKEPAVPERPVLRLHDVWVKDDRGLDAVKGASFEVHAGEIVALAGMDVSALRPAPRAAREPRQVRQGLGYVARTPDLLVPLMMLAVVGTLAFEFQVVLPLLAPDAPVVTWWFGAPPHKIAHDPLGVVAGRRVTDSSLAADPLHAVALGSGRSLEQLDALDGVVLSASR